MVLNLIKYLISKKFGNISQIVTAEFADWLLNPTKPQPLI